MLTGQYLAHSCRNAGIDPRTARRHLGHYLYKRKHRWHAIKGDPKKYRLERALTVYADGKLKVIKIDRTEEASKVGDYFNSLKQVLATNDLALLEKYKEVPVKDSKGKKHWLETDIQKIQEAELRRENLEMAEIYAYD